MSVRIGIDGGQSTLRLGVAGSRMRTEAAGFSYDQSDPYAALVTAVQQAWRRTGAAEPVDTAVLGLSGAPAAAGHRCEMARAVARAIGAGTVWISGDVTTAHAGAFPDAHGVVLAAGTGTVALGIDAGTGTSRRVDGWGHLFGDGGSAFATGQAGIAAALRDYDGRGEPTSMTAVLTERFGRLDLVPERLYTSGTRVAEVARFGLDVLAAAESGDAVAAGIIAGSAHALAQAVRAAAAAIPRGPIPVVVTGRWLTSPQLRAPFETELATIPRIELAQAAGDGVDGACRLAAGSDLGPYTEFFDGTHS